MKIPFPKMHIAQSVLNRISNTLEEKGPLGMANHKPAPVKVQDEPEVPNPAPLGAEVDRKIEAPSPQIGVPPETETDANNGMLEASVMGGSPFDGALLGSGL